MDRYDYGARFYDAAIARWGVIDPAAIHYYSETQYGYVKNNPLYFNDPTGMFPESDWLRARGEDDDTDELDKRVKNELWWQSHHEKMLNELYWQPKITGNAQSSEDRKGDKEGSGGDELEGPNNSNEESIVERLDHLEGYSDAANYLKATIGLIQMGMLDYRMALPLHSKIGTFRSFLSQYQGLGIGRKLLGRTGLYIGVPLKAGLDLRAYMKGNINNARLAYRMGTLGVSIGVGYAVGGSAGAAAGTVVGGILEGVEYIYDNVIVPLGNEIRYQIWNTENAIKNGWDYRR